MPFTEIAQIGERGLIELIRDLVEFTPEEPPLTEGLVKGVSDDAVVHRPTAGAEQLFTTDSMVEGVDFDLTYTSFKHLSKRGMEMVRENADRVPPAWGGWDHFSVTEFPPRMRE